MGSGPAAKAAAEAEAEATPRRPAPLLIYILLAVSLVLNVAAARWLNAVVAAARQGEGAAGFAVIAHPALGGRAATLAEWATQPKAARFAVETSDDGLEGARALARAVGEWAIPILADREPATPPTQATVQEEDLDALYADVEDAQDEDVPAPIDILVNLAKDTLGAEEVAASEGETQTKISEEVQITVRRGDDVDAVVAEFAKTHGLDAEATNALRQQVTARALHARIVPVLSLPLQFDDKEADFDYYNGDNATLAVLQFAKRHRLTRANANMLHAKVTEVLMARRVIPAASVPIDVDGKPHELKVFQGDDIKKVVDEFLASFDSASEEQSNRLVGALRAQLVSKRLLPLSVLEVQVPAAADAGDGASPRTERALVFQGDSVDEVVDRFLKSLDLAPEAKLPLAADVRATVVKGLQGQGHLPLATVPLNFSGRNFSLPIFEGTDLTETVRQFVEVNKLEGSNVQAIASAVYAHLAAEKIVPAAEIVHEIPPAKEGDAPRTMRMRFFDGDDAAAKIDAAIKDYGLPEDVRPQLQAKLRDQLRRRRMLPIAEVPVLIPEKKVNVTLPIYLGDQS